MGRLDKHTARDEPVITAIRGEEMRRKFPMMRRAMSIGLVVFCLAACHSDEPNANESGGANDAANNAKNDVSDTGVPTVTSTATFPVLEEIDITFAEGLAHDATSTDPFAVPLKLDVYYPDSTSTNRPLFMFIHGGGFKGGTKTKPEILEMADYYASRGWVFASIDYRTVEEMCDTENMPPCEDKLKQMAQQGPDAIVEFYQGIAPKEWLDFLLEQKHNPKETKKRKIQAWEHHLLMNVLPQA